MLTVYKYPVSLTDDFSIQMPAGAQLLSFQTQREEAQLWALVDPSVPLVARHFRLAGTGHPIEIAAERLRFVMSAAPHALAALRPDLVEPLHDV